MQVDSDVERTFAANNLKERGDVAFLYFKFPPKFKINLPKIINNYNPDWGIVRQINESVINLEIVVETKGGSDTGCMKIRERGMEIACRTVLFRTRNSLSPRRWFPIFDGNLSIRDKELS